MEENSKPLPDLEAAEQRIIGALIEKSKTTPDYYPMTINGLTSACNQKTSRNPVVNYSEETITLTLDRLKSKGLATTVTGGSSRVTKWKHNLGLVYGLLPDELAVICLLLLRGPLTPGEINSNAGRLYEFDHIEEVQTVLNKLSAGESPYVQQLEKKPGQKEARYIHLLGLQFALESDADTAHVVPAATIPEDLEMRLSRLEQGLEELKEMVNLLMSK